MVSMDQLKGDGGEKPLEEDAVKREQGIRKEEVV
jgi:hypothetical protein